MKQKKHISYVKSAVVGGGLIIVIALSLAAGISATQLGQYKIDLVEAEKKIGYCSEVSSSTGSDLQTCYKNLDEERKTTEPLKNESFNLRNDVRVLANRILNGSKGALILKKGETGKGTFGCGGGGSGESMSWSGLVTVTDISTKMDEYGNAYYIAKIKITVDGNSQYADSADVSSTSTPATVHGSPMDVEVYDINADKVLLEPRQNSC